VRFCVLKFTYTSPNRLPYPAVHFSDMQILLIKVSREHLKGTKIELRIDCENPVT
jgi:hypothetical protein